jgi:hypothetical protein
MNTLKRQIKQLKHTKKVSKCINIDILDLKYKDVGYLKNPICKFIPLYDFDNKLKKNVVSVCFFKLRTGSYKNFNKYLNGLKILHKKIINEKPDFFLKIFIDYSIYSDINIMRILREMDKVELVLYSCSNFCVSKYHIGTFGTLIRFFPLFNLPNNDTSHVIISDIDVTEKDLPFWYYDKFNTIYEKNIINKLYLIISGRPEHDNDLNIKYIYNKGNTKIVLPYVLADRVIGINKLEFKTIELFLNKVLKNKNIKYSTYYSQLKYNKKKCDGNICFGIDEYYLNRILLLYIFKNNLPFGVSLRLNKLSFFYFKNNNNINKLYAYLPEILDGIPKEIKGKTNKEQYNYLLNVFYSSGKQIELKNYNKIHILIIQNLVNFYNKQLNLSNRIVNKDLATLLLQNENVLSILENKLYFV